MEKIPLSWERKYKPLKLFKEDIEEIFRIVKENSTEADTDIIIDEFRLEKPEELGEINKSIINELYINISTATLQLSLGCRDAHLWVGSREDTRLMGIAIRIDELLQKKQRFMGFFTFGIRPYLTSFFLGVPIGFLSKYFYTKLFTPILVLSLITFLVIEIALIASAVHIRTHFTMIHMTYSYEKSNFFKRNKDTIFLMIISSAVTLIATLIVQWIIKKF